jgi:1,4-dihydroxy-2-naphthoate octaprenyltransferase
MSTEQHSREEILECLDDCSFATVATHDGNRIRTRSMHFANDDDFTFYFASMKGDPKIKQMEMDSDISLLINQRAAEEVDTAEIEVSGRATVVQDEGEQQRILEILTHKSPVVRSAFEAGMTNIFSVISITPRYLKYRIFREIVRGVPPTVLEFEELATAASSSGQAEWTTTSEKVKRWVQEVRVPFLTASAVPVALGGAIAFAATGLFDWWLFALTLIAGISLQAGTNTANDYFDHKSQNDEVNTEYVRPFTGGSRVIQKGLMTPRAVLIESIVLHLVAIIIGLYLVWQVGPAILVLGAIGVFSSIFYTAPPFKLVNRGFGEFFIGLNFGPLMTFGAYYVQTGTLSWVPIVASLPVALLIAAVLYINEYPDYSADKAVGKKTLVVRFGKEQALRGYEALMFAPYAIILLGVAVALIPGGTAYSGLPVFALLGLLTIPKALTATKAARNNYSDSILLIPAMASTIMAHLQTGLLLAAGFLLQGAWLYFISTVI